MVVDSISSSASLPRLPSTGIQLYGPQIHIVSGKELEDCQRFVSFLLIGTDVYKRSMKLDLVAIIWRIFFFNMNLFVVPFKGTIVFLLSTCLHVRFRRVELSCFFYFVYSPILFFFFSIDVC